MPSQWCAAELIKSVQQVNLMCSFYLLGLPSVGASKVDSLAVQHKVLALAGDKA